jgi:DNA-binding CsgD family transcriptional regulator
MLEDFLPLCRDGLTRREAQVLYWLRIGYTNKQIARQLGISPGTTRAHVSHILDKLDVPNRTAAAEKATTWLSNGDQ